MKPEEAQEHLRRLADQVFSTHRERAVYFVLVDLLKESVAMRQEMEKMQGGRIGGVSKADLLTALEQASQLIHDFRNKPDKIQNYNLQVDPVIKRLRILMADLKEAL